MIKHTIVGLILDIPDWLGFGLIPIVGDLLDIIGTIYFTKVLGPIGIAGAIELIPLADVLPTFTCLGLYADMKGEK
jgi:hypothetical protein